MADRFDTSAGPALRAVLLDALGTTVELSPPLPALAELLGIEADEQLRSAVGEEMRFYRAHATEATDARALEALRERCARIVSDGIGRPVSSELLMRAIRFRAFADVLPAIRTLRSRGLRIACVSNWDCDLASVLDRVGLGDCFDAVVASAEAGRAKPDPAPFRLALERLGVEPGEAVHVGDTRGEDVAGAHAAGVGALLIDRSGGGGDIAGLGELPALLDLGERPYRDDSAAPGEPA